MTDTPESLAARLENSGQKAMDFFAGLTPDQWQHELYSDGAAWSVFEMFSHVVEAEGSLARLIASIAAGGPGVPEDFDRDRYNESKVKMNTVSDPAEQVKLFGQRRVETVQMVAAFTPEDLQKPGRHPFLEETVVAEMLKLMYLHVQLHVRDVRKALKNS